MEYVRIIYIYVVIYLRKTIYYFVAADVVSVEAVAGETVYIPCNLTTPDTTDNVSLILWYRQDKGTPVYRYVQHNFTLHVVLRELQRPPYNQPL